jgi:CTP synthase
MVVCRSEKHLDKAIRKKLGMFCNVDTNNVLESPDVAHTIYECPIFFAEQNIDTIILKHFGRECRESQIGEWIEYIEKVTKAEEAITIAIVGKYTEASDAYKSINEALIHTGVSLKIKVNIKLVSSETLETDGKDDYSKAEEILKDVDGVLIPGGFGDRGLEGKIAAVKYARINNLPFFGICLGMQIAIVEYARNMLGYEDACHREDNKNTTHPVIVLMNQQKEVVNKGGTMRLGGYPCKLSPDSLAFRLYGEENISERHRHRHEFNNEYREEFIKNGMSLSGLSSDGQLVEIIELKNHPHFIGVQFHPEFKSRPIKPHPLFVGFVDAAKRKRDEKND